MPFWKLYYHLIWGTKNKQPFITPDIEQHLYPLLIHRASKMGVFVYAVNGWRDHVHLVTAVPPKRAVSQVVQDLKGASSHFINIHRLLEERFQWQRGYGALSLGETQRPFAEAYVNNQKQHHVQKTTNRWLERISAEDQGIKVPQMFRETGVIYEVEDEFPF